MEVKLSVSSQSSYSTIVEINNYVVKRLSEMMDTPRRESGIFTTRSMA